MINTVWFFLIFISIFTAVAEGKLTTVSDSIFKNAAHAVEFTIGLAGAIAFWSGMLKIAEVSGITRTIARLFQPLLIRLFPVLKGHRNIIGLISMTVTANLLGLGNVATPLGLRTMEELQKLNPRPERASDTICTFLSLILGGLCILPTTLIAVRAKAGSANPGAILVPVILVSLTGTVTGLTANYLFLHACRWFRRKE